jgi:pilus assembly protein CpaB
MGGMNRRTITIAIAAVLALGLGLVVYGLMTAPHKVVIPPRNVVVAAMRIPAHAHIVPAMLTVVQKQADQVDPTALVNPSDALGQIAMADIPQAAPILAGEIVRPATPPPDQLNVRNGMRAVTISIDQVKGLAGLLRPGDHVDVIAAPPRGPGTPQAYTIVRDARVLAVGSMVSSAGPQMPQPGSSAVPQPTPNVQIPTTATLEVTPGQADLVASADINATLRLTLRSPQERADSQPVQPIEYPTPSPILTPTPPPNGIPVINGDSVQIGNPPPTQEPQYIVVPRPPEAQATP